MFRSRCTCKEYLKLIENEEPSLEHLCLDFESDEDDDYDISDEDDVSQIYFDPSLVAIPDGFNDDEEVLVIGMYILAYIYNQYFRSFRKISDFITLKRPKL